MLSKRNTMAASQKKEHALVRIQRPQALNFKDHALVEYNGLKPLNRIIKPMLDTLSSQSLHHINVRCISLKLFDSSHGQGQDRLTLMNKPSEKSFCTVHTILSSLIWTDHLHYHTKYQGNNASHESHWGQKNLKNINKEVKGISIFGMNLSIPESYSRIQGFRKQESRRFQISDTYL